MIRTKCIFYPAGDIDGTRISIMSRHTLNDGITFDPRILGRYNEHLKILAPPEKLVGGYHRNAITWGEFSRGYVNYLRQPIVNLEVASLAQRGLTEDLTLLCVEEMPKDPNEKLRCHRRLLAEELLKYQPALRVDIK